jgi:hypothetical protein
VAECLRASTPEGLSAILAIAGGEALEQWAGQLLEGGRLAYPTGVTPQPRKRRQLRVIPYDAEASSQKFEQLNRAVAEAQLKVVMAKTYKLEEAAQAHARLEQGPVIGRIRCRFPERSFAPEGRHDQIIIVPLDGSAFSEQALPTALSIAKRDNADLELVHIYEMIWPHLTEGAPALDQERRRRALERPEKLADQLDATESARREHGLSHDAPLENGASHSRCGE